MKSCVARDSQSRCLRQQGAWKTVKRRSGFFYSFASSCFSSYHPVGALRAASTRTVGRPYETLPRHMFVVTGCFFIQTSRTAYLLRARRAAESSRRATRPPEDPCPRRSILTARSSAHAGWSITAVDPGASSDPRTPSSLTIARRCHCCGVGGKTRGET